MGLTERIRGLFGDPLLFALILGLSLFGTAMIYSAGQLDVPDPATVDVWQRQLLWLGLSIIALAGVMRIEVKWFEWAAVPLYGLAIIALVLTLFIGTGAGTAQGVKSWLRVGAIGVQPSQFANLATILMLGRIMGARREPPQTLGALWKPLIVVAVPLGLVFLQPDLGTAMVFGAVLLATLYWGGTPAGVLFMLLSPLLGLFLAFHSWLFSVYMIALIVFLYLYRVYLWEGTLVAVANLAAGTVAVPLWDSLAPYQKARLQVFLDPMVDPRGAGWNVIQSRVAIGSGGLFGKGFTEGTQKRLAFLPEQHTDFIFSVIGEETGFLGTTLVLLAFGVILWRLVKIAERVA
ncbi:MAG: FtsW/RodA/SpoVE family cell cycle protein, partial [Gemmatimonadetes bacterium]|nr:FtsW/RodA/SpoVE family cell cycle protein [Gemmatimonadota bacterium]NIQ59139.1 FtsW/RodA/SpoVE family cell cycle protein [Gemmatimonadota bacterium]NIU79343.1 FtsW/RodA/SpoVE family cell cycle protein [Gammaproteobacteria bacterium]NIX48011.1 FtsW/RodA/SpoVE family cell cycle protein [Gemmatimonadota bacterium]NIY07391.1 FtsW/RodA/SpoVE family cell cycle protein [Gemmatimonadota bacterium]